MASLRFYTGDERGRISSLSCSLLTPEEPAISSDVVYTPATLGKDRAVQFLALTRDEVPLLACARADGSASLYSMKEDASLNPEASWTPAKFASTSSRFVALDSVPERGVLTCSSAGRLVLTSQQGEPVSTALLSANLKDLRLSADSRYFLSGGDEVDLSTWDLEKSFATSDASTSDSAQSTKKRKKDEPLHPAETWRAKNVPYDNLNLRVPVHITSLTYLGNPNEILTGTSFGAVRRYDTRAARRPVANWTDVILKGAVKRVERGVSEYDVFVSDERGQLFALDIRNGKHLYSYKGIGGTVTSFVLDSTNRMLSSSMDRYVRLHSTFAPPATAGQNMDGRGEIAAKLYIQDVVTAVVATCAGASMSSQAEEDGEEIWDQMANADDEDHGRLSRRKRRKE